MSIKVIITKNFSHMSEVAAETVKKNIGQVIVGVGHPPFIANALCGIKLFVYVAECFGKITDLIINARNTIKYISQTIIECQQFRNFLRFE